MIGTTLVDLRERVEALASADGEYYVVCGRTGDRPVPVSGLRFDGRASARRAVRAAERYRTVLRRYDPRVPYYDLIVCRDAGRRRSVRQVDQDGREADPHALSNPVRDECSTAPERRRLVEFCHATAAAVFEVLSEEGYDAVETAVMDRYVELAETIPDPDDLGLCLLESVATALDERVSPAEQADVLAGAATRLPPTEVTERPVSRTLSRLEECGLLGGYTRSPWSVRVDDGTRSAVVRITGYELGPRDGRLPVLPIVLGVSRHHPAWFPSSIRAVEVDDGWRIALEVAQTAEPSGLVSAPIESET